MVHFLHCLLKQKNNVNKNKRTDCDVASKPLPEAMFFLKALPTRRGE